MRCICLTSLVEHPRLLQARIVKTWTPTKPQSARAGCWDPSWPSSAWARCTGASSRGPSSATSPSAGPHCALFWAATGWGRASSSTSCSSPSSKAGSWTTTSGAGARARTSTVHCGPPRSSCPSWACVLTCCFVRSCRQRRLILAGTPSPRCELSDHHISLAHASPLSDAVIYSFALTQEWTLWCKIAGSFPRPLRTAFGSFSRRGATVATSLRFCGRKNFLVAHAASFFLDMFGAVQLQFCFSKSV
mmetsp:Transcript_91473/g.238583  ORF Transcript_91473/g.238583 Transcript_91473/m.238583 type:complete len:247 (+) Transcript_91473:438-1178(+)